MYLSKLDIFGFKSFAEKTSIEFDKGVSAIVGPNGSGKSNIVDALRWVLGEQGDKALRSEKREDVVFSGTRSRKPLGMAEVALTIINNKNILPTEYSEVQIARRFYRNGDTEYFLNGTKVRLKDIKNLFIDTGIGPDAYSVIELKMVETILSHVKNERRKLFEEAAGIVSYKKNRDLTFNKLDSVHEALSRVNDIIREKQRNVNALERQVKRNEEAKIVSEELREQEIKAGQYDYNSLLNEIEAIKAGEGEKINLKESLSFEIQSYDKIAEEHRTQLRESETELSRLMSLYQQRTEELNTSEKHMLVTEQQVKAFEKNISRLQAEIESSIANIKSGEQRIEDLQQEISVLKNTIFVSETSLTSKKQKVDETVKLISEKKNELADIGIKLKSLNKEIHSQKTIYSEKNHKLNSNFAQLEKITQQNESAIFSINKLNKEKSELESTLELSRSDLKKAEAMLEEGYSLKLKLENESKELEKELNGLIVELQKTQTKHEYLKNVSESLEDYAEGIKYLIKEEKEEGVATLIDIIEVDQKYVTAIETALGEVSNYLIVNDSKHITRLVNKLVNNRKGKISFILQDRLLSSQMYFENYFGEPDFLKDTDVIGFADSVVSCKNKIYAPLLKYILEEYVIVKDLDAAMRLANDNYYKFITLDGDIVTDSFIRAGSQSNTEMFKLGRSEKITNLEQESELLNSKINHLKESIKIKNAELNEINIELLTSDAESKRKQESKNETELSKVEFKLEELNRAVINYEMVYSQLEKENNELNKEINQQILVINNLEGEHNNLDKELSFLTEEFNIIEQTFTEVQSDYNSFNIHFVNLNNEFKNHQQNLERIRSGIENRKRTVEAAVKQKDSENLDKQNLLEIISQKAEEIIRLRTNAEEAKEVYEKNKLEYNAKLDAVNKIDIEQRDRRQKYDKVSQGLINSQIKIKENEIKAEQIKEQLLKKYEIQVESLEQMQLEDDFDIVSLRAVVDELSERLKKLGGGYQQLLFEDFENEKVELAKLIEQKEDLIESEKDIRKTIERINKEARERFLETFEKIRENFIMIFNQLFQEGDEANLRLVYDIDDDGKINEDPLESKIEIVAKPRGKRPTSIELLSGGEKTLTAIALLFAIYLVKPSPFCVLDEVDAPLDVANLGRFNNMIRRFSDNTQFILITHNERTMETVDRLYGVTMQEPGVTTIVETRFKDSVKV